MLWIYLPKLHPTYWTKFYRYSYGINFWISWLILLIVLQIIYGFKTDMNNNHYKYKHNYNHSTKYAGGKMQMQRRFLWNEMDKNVEQFVGNAMKHMLKGYMNKKRPTTLQYAIPDNVPTETIRITYIIKNPQTKEMKIIKMRPTKKIITMMEALKQQPTMLESMNVNVNNNQPGSPWLMHSSVTNAFEKNKDKDNVIMTEMALLSATKSRQQQQQLQSPHEQQEKQQQKQQQQHIAADNITFNDTDNSWLPILSAMNNQKKFLIRKSKKNLTTLHTHVVGSEQLPKPQQLIGDSTRRNLSAMPMYEVTERNIEEETMEQPFHIQHEQNYHSTTFQIDRTPVAATDSYDDHFKNEQQNYPNFIRMENTMNSNNNNKTLVAPQNHLISAKLKVKRKPTTPIPTTASTISDFDGSKLNLLPNTLEESFNIQKQQEEQSQQHQQQEQHLEQEPIEYYNTLMGTRVMSQIHPFHQIIRHTRNRGSVKYGDKIFNAKHMESKKRINNKQQN